MDTTGKNKGKEEDEVPLEIEDYSCNTFFEATIGEIERYLVEEFSTQLGLQRFLVYSKHHRHEQDGGGGEGNVVSTNNTGCGNMVLGRNFTVGHGGSHSKREDITEGEGIAVEIHVQCVHHHHHHQRRQWHPITRLFALPLFFIVRGTTTAPSYRTSESSFYLSLLTTAVSRAMRGPFLLRFDGDPSLLLSPFFYADGIAPCFVAVGDHYQLAFSGVAPAVMVGGGSSSDSVQCWPLSRLIAQPVVKCRFHCTAYPRPPEWCQHVSDYLDMFQLQIGPQSRVRTDVFDGICVSLQRTFQLKIPRRFRVGNSNALENVFGGANVSERKATMTWFDVLEIENETMLLSAGPTTFPFGTGTAPLRGVDFFFQWSQIHDMEVQDDGRRCSNLNPFAPEGMLLQNKLTIKAVALPKKECELNHTACKDISEHMYRVMEHLSSGKELRLWQRIPETLLAMADEIVYGHTVDLSAQKALIARLTKHQPQDGSVTREVRNVYFPGSLLCRFAYVCANQLDVVDDVPILWAVVVDRLKDLLEGRDGRRHSLQQLIKTIGVLPVEEIDHGLPLLVQKLQLLSYCARRMLRECEPTVAKQPADGWDDELEDLLAHNNTGELSVDAGELTGCGVVSSGKRLITNGEPLVEPQVLPIPPCTSDVLMTKAQELQNLGTASAGQHARAWIQSEGLFNDMCVFLYVNRAHEGRVVRFPDFVQWHSPRDFIPPSGDSKQGVKWEEDDDDAYLSERMRHNSTDKNGLVTNVWWPLWKRATPRSPEEIIAQSFVPHEQARLILRWMEKDLSSMRLLLETVHANVSNSLHRLLSHRCVENNPAIAAYALSKSEAIATSLKTISQTDDAVINAEGVRTMYSIAISQIGEIETCLCASLAIERVLDATHNVSDAPPADTPCASLGQLVAALSSPAERSTELTLREASLSLDVWHRDGIKCRFTEDSQTPVAMQLRATCMAERPLNTTACFQQMIAETDETGVLRVALALTEEVL